MCVDTVVAKSKRLPVILYIAHANVFSFLIFFFFFELAPRINFIVATFSCCILCGAAA